MRHTTHFAASTRLLALAGALLALGASTLRAQPAPTPNPLIPLYSSLLQNVSLGAEQSSVKWTDFSNKNTTLAPVSGTGTVTPFASGYKASYGFYSFSNDYAVKFSTAAADFFIGKVSLQVVSMANPDFWNEQAGTGDPDAILFFDYNHQDHGYGTGGYGHPNPDPLSGSYNTALNNLSAGVAAYSGGPVLRYVVDGVTHVYQGTPTGTVLGDGVYSDLVSGMSGWYYNFSWDWDLSGIAGITSVSIDVPVPVHQSTGGAALTVAAVPEPATCAILAGLGALAPALFRRRA